jgi:hypothetical protein
LKNLDRIARPAGRAILFSVAAFLLAGCGSSGASEQAEDAGDPAISGQVTVRVENRTNPPVPLTIFLRSAVGQRTLGSVGGGRTRSFTIDVETAGSVEYRLAAQRPDGTELDSTPFRVAQGQTVNWRLPTGGLTVGY